MAGVTTFEIFKQLLLTAINNDSTLDDSARASMVTRVNYLTKTELIGLTYAEAADGNTQGSVTVDQALKAIKVGTGTTGTNRVEYALQSFTLPVTIRGDFGQVGALVGHEGNGADPLLDVAADVSLQYRLSSTDTWKAFDRQTVLTGVTSIQFAADIVDQVSDATMPSLYVVALQE